MQCTYEQPLGFDLQLSVIDTSELLVVVKCIVPLNDHCGSIRSEWSLLGLVTSSLRAQARTVRQARFAFVIA